MKIKLFDKWFKKEVAEVPIKNSSNSINILDSLGYWKTSPNSENFFENNYVVNRGIEMISDMLANIPMRLFKGDQELPKDYIFPNGFNIQKPHPYMTLKELMYKAYIHYFYHGEFTIRIIDDVFLYLDVINPKELERINTDLWRYQGSTIVKTEELIYLPMYNPCNTGGESRGLSPIDVVKGELENDQAALDYITACFENGSTPGTVLKDVLGETTSNDRDRMKVQFEAINKGVKKTGGTAVLPKGIDITYPNNTPHDMQFLDARVAIRDRILSVIGLPKILFNGTEGINRAVAEELTRQLWATNLKPKGIKVHDKFNQQLWTPRFPGYRCEPDFSNVKELQENMESVLKQCKAFRELGFTLNELIVKFDLGFDHITDAVGDMRFIPSNFIPADDLLMEDETPPPVKKESNSLTMGELETLLNPKVELKSSGSYTRKYKKITRKVEKDIFNKLGSYFSNQLGAILSIVKKNYKEPKVENKLITKSNLSNSHGECRIELSDKDINALILKIYNRLEKDKQVVKGIVTPILEKGSLNASGFALTTINDTSTAIVNTKVVSKMANKITGINDTTYKILKREITNGVKAGESLAEMTKRVGHVFKFSKSRSRMIAATESANIVNRTTFETYKDKKVKRKSWLAVGDSATRDTHAACAAEGAIPFDHSFSNGLMYPSDPAGSAGETINCRCCLMGVI